MPDLKLDSPLQFVKGVGPRKAEIMAHHGLATVHDLLWFFPRLYLDRTCIVPIAEAALDESVTIIGTIKAHGILHGRRKRYEAILEDESGAISLVWFGGVRYWERFFKKGMVVAATGRPTYFMGRQMVHPELERLDDDADKMIHAGRIVPVYPQTSDLNKVGLTSRGMRRVTSFVVDHLAEAAPDHLPERERGGLDLMDLNEALLKIHYPETREQVEQCRRRLAFEELLAYQFLVVSNRQRRQGIAKAHSYREPGERMTAFREALPFEMTRGQKRTTREIIDDLRRSTPMARLLQGDVGCGKTVVAIAAALYAVENGHQVAFMAPTEILAEQHFRNWREALKAVGCETALLTSGLKKAQKETIGRAAADGSIDLLLGTHALIYDYVQFERLGLVIIDEQHRFGVQQRSRLHAKGDQVDLLAMTATPIPRTLALTLYGDLDVSTIDDLPPGRVPPRTVWRTTEVKEKVFEFIHREAAAGGQTYIIYPTIEKSDRVELEALEDAYKELSEGPLHDLRVGMVHGRIKATERDALLSAFREGVLDVLMATTVVEVGMDNPNASMMIIEHAERFGLAQLHQLRGRVGRGERKSTVVALAHPPLSDLARQRLEYFAETTDGFKVAEADLQLRGPGEVFGQRQSGLPELRIARMPADQDLITSARELLERMFRSDRSVDRQFAGLHSHLVAKTKSMAIAFDGG